MVSGARRDHRPARFDREVPPRSCSDAQSSSGRDRAHPAHNEESVIVQTVNSVLHSDLKDLHIIVVNDGSADRTGELLDTNFSRDPRVRIIHQVNRGKAAALNLAMSLADTEIVVTIDADTEIEPDAIGKLIRHFSDPKVGAVAGNVKVGNRSRWLTRWQALEYITSQNMEKRAFDLLNCITVVPGALGAWRKKAIEAAGALRRTLLPKMPI